MDDHPLYSTKDEILMHGIEYAGYNMMESNSIE